MVISDTDAIYLYGLDIIAEQLAQSDRYYYMHDGLGSVRQLVDSTGQVAETYAYDPFGVPLSGDSVPNPYRFTGEAWDAEVELLYLRARYYQPATGRFITEDPWPGDLSRPGRLNGFVYAQNSPINFVDPSGLNGEDPLSFLWDTPPVVRWLRRQMIQNAQGPIVEWLSVLNESEVRGMNPIQVQRAIADKIDAFRLFGWMVRPGGPWDPKPEIGKGFRYHQQVGDHWYYYDVWGNIMFGYLGTAAGFSAAELLNGAGAVQFFSDIQYAWDYKDPCLLPRPRPWYYIYTPAVPWVWDHPEDRVTTMIGIRLWKHRIDVQARHIIDGVVDAGDKDQIPRWDERP